MHHYKLQHVAFNRNCSQKSTSDSNESIVTYTKCIVLFTSAESCGRCNVHIRWRSNWEFYLDNLHRLWTDNEFVQWDCEKLQWDHNRSHLLKYVYCDLTVSELNKSQKNVLTRISLHWCLKLQRSSTISHDLSIVVFVTVCMPVGT